MIPGIETLRYRNLDAEGALKLASSNPDFNKAEWSKYIVEKLAELTYAARLTANVYHRPMEDRRPVFHILNVPSEYHYIAYGNEALLYTSDRTYIDPVTKEVERFTNFMLPTFRISRSGEVSVGWFSGDYKDDFTILLDIPTEHVFKADPFLDYTFNRNLSLPVPKPTPSLVSSDFI